MKFIDTHTHLFLKQFNGDIDKVIQESIENNVTKFLLPNINSSTTGSMLNLCKKYPENCYPMMGLHPCDIKSESVKKELNHVKDMLSRNIFIAVGEIGIDLYWDKTNLNDQKQAFTYQIKLAKEYNLPIVIHVRNSFDETIKIVEKLNDENLRGVFHCFTGDINEANRIINLDNFYLGIGGVLTFKNSGLDKTIKNVHLKNIILETDSPFLSPTPYRGKRNESKYLINIAKKLAEIHNVSLEEIGEVTTKNASKLFSL